MKIISFPMKSSFSPQFSKEKNPKTFLIWRGGVFVEGKLKVSSSFLGFELFLVFIKLWSVCIYSFLFLWIYLVFSTIILLKMLLQVHLYNLVCYAFTCVKKKRFIYTWIYHTSSRLNKPHWETLIRKTTIFFMKLIELLCYDLWFY